MSQTSSTALLLDLSLPTSPTFPIQTPSSPPRSLTPSGGLSCTLQPSSAENRPRQYLKFPSPMPKSLGMRTAREWHREQLLQARLRMEQRNALRLKRGQIPTTLTTSLTCDHAREDAGLSTTVTDIPLHRDPDNPQHPYPFHPGHYPNTSLRELRSDRVDNLPRSLPTWQLFASRVGRSTVLGHPARRRKYRRSTACLPCPRNGGMRTTWKRSSKSRWTT